MSPVPTKVCGAEGGGGGGGGGTVPGGGTSEGGGVGVFGVRPPPHCADASAIASTIVPTTSVGAARLAEDLVNQNLTIAASCTRRFGNAEIGRPNKGDSRLPTYSS